MKTTHDDPRFLTKRQAEIIAETRIRELEMLRELENGTTFLAQPFAKKRHGKGRAQGLGRRSLSTGTPQSGGNQGA